MNSLKYFNQYEINEEMEFFKKMWKAIKGDADLSDALSEYDIKTVQPDRDDNYSYKFYHDGRLVARIFQPEGEEGSKWNMPRFKLCIYLYSDETKNTKGLNATIFDEDNEINDELINQARGRRPYYTYTKLGAGIEFLVQSFYEFWATKTKSGRRTTSKLNKPQQKAQPSKHFSPSYRRSFLTRKFI